MYSHIAGGSQAQALFRKVYGATGGGASDGLLFRMAAPSTTGS
jgi:hypothetical protein